MEISGAELLPAPSAAKQESDKVSNKLVTEDLAMRGARYYPEELVAAEKRAKGEHARAE